MPVRNDYVVKAHTVRKGDIIDREGVESNADAIKSGPKWTEVRDADGELILRIPNETDILISRMELTEEEREARRRWMRNETIADWLDDYQVDWAHAQSEFGKQIEGGYEPERYSFIYSALIYAQAEHSIKANYLALYEGVREHTNPEADHAEVWEQFSAKAREDLVDMGFKGNSRSTSQIHNALEDIQNEVLAKAVRRLARY